MSDPRDELITVTMTGEQWDSCRAHAGISSYVRWEAEEAARAKLDEAQAGQAARRAVTLAEVEAKLNPLNAQRKRKIKAEIRRLLAEHDAGTLKVDHLGSPSRAFDGWRVSFIPHTAGGRPAINVQAPQVHFEGCQYPMTVEDCDWVVRTIRAASGEDGEAWGRGGSWVSVIV